MAYILALLATDLVLVTLAFVYIWLALIPAWLTQKSGGGAPADRRPGHTVRRGSAAIALLHQRRLPKHLRQGVVFSNTRAAG